MKSPHREIPFVRVVQNRQIRRNRKQAVGYQRIGEKGREEMMGVSWLRETVVPYVKCGVAKLKVDL